MFFYEQKTGILRFGEKQIAQGYSGHDVGRNNPSMEDVRSTGPIPRGEYEIGPMYDTKSMGPHVMPVTPVGHNALGRSGFFIHGDNSTNDASHGCIILPRAIRDFVATSGDKKLMVVSGVA